MSMVGIVGVAVLSGDVDVAMVPSQLGMTTMVNMMHHLPHVVSLQVHQIQVSGYRLVVMYKCIIK